MTRAAMYSPTQQKVQPIQPMPEKVQDSDVSLRLLVQSGQYVDALSCYQLLQSPTAAETRLAGHAAWGKGDFIQATIYLNRAYLQGEHGASVDVLRLSVLQNQFDNLESKISSIELSYLQNKDKIQLEILKGEIALKQEKLSVAKKHFIDAWISANTYEDCSSLIPSIARNLFVVCHATACDLEAIGYLEKAFLGATGIWRPYLQLSKAQADLMLGNYFEFERTLDKIPKATINNAHFKMIYTMAYGLHDFLTQKYKSALDKLWSAIHGTNEIKVNASLVPRVQYYLIGIMIQQKLFDQARGQLCQLEINAQTQGEIAMFNHRKGQFLAARGLFMESVELLESARETFLKLEWRRELGWTLLQLAHVYLNLGNAPKAGFLLEAVTDLINIAENAAFLELERQFIGDLQPLIAIASSYGLHALNHHQPLVQTVLVPPVPTSITFRSFGAIALSLNGQPVICKLNRAFAVMAYLLLYPHSTLDKILSDVFEDSKDTEAARNYFHTSRYELRQALPCVQFAYDRFTKTYSVDSGSVPIDFDYQETMRLLHAPTENEFYQALEKCQGAFMHGYEALWLEEVRANVEWLLVRSGLKLVQEMYEAGDFQACRRLTERLLKVEPFDESLNELLVRATREVEGALASRKAMSLVESQFLQEVGELPPTLAQLKREMKFRVN
jgi:DNA-binding SARP family transcriptional activator